MRLTYHQLILGSTKTYAEKKFLRMEQGVDCTTQQGVDYEEVKLFGFTPGDSSTLRSLLYEIPTGMDEVDFLEIIESYPNARIIRQISHEPVISPSEREFVRSGLLSIDQIAKRQLVRDSSTVYIDRYGMPVYAQNKLSLTGEYQDQDYRITIDDAGVPVQLSIVDVPIYTVE